MELTFFGRGSFDEVVFSIGPSFLVPFVVISDEFSFDLIEVTVRVALGITFIFVEIFVVSGSIWKYLFSLLIKIETFFFVIASLSFVVRLSILSILAMALAAGFSGRASMTAETSVFHSH